VTDVERFESVMAEKLGPHAIIKVEGEYVQPAMRLALIAWQASRRAALEEAASAALNASLDAIWADGRLMDAREIGSACAAAIRELAKETNNG
jgi:hypothetical protein